MPANTLGNPWRFSAVKRASVPLFTSVALAAASLKRSKTSGRRRRRSIRGPQRADFRACLGSVSRAGLGGGAASAIEVLRDAMRLFCGNQPQSDDVTLLALRFVGPA